MGQFAWPDAPSLRTAIILPDPPQTDNPAVNDWMQKAKAAIDLLAAGNPEVSRFLDDLITAVNPVQLVASHLIIATGAGSPEGVITANVGSLYLRNDGGATTTLYVKTSGTGNTGWTAK